MIGEILKKRREDLGRDLREISGTLKIKHAYLKAIEDGDSKLLPADVYVKGYIHEYARILGLNPNAIVSAYTRESSLPPEDKSGLPSNENPPRRSFRLRYVLIPLIFIVLATITALTLFPAPQKEIVQKKIVQTVPVQERKAVAPRAEISGYDLEAVATDTTWMLVTIDNKTSKEILMQPGESAKWHAENCFFLKIGNAGGVKLVFNGKEIGKLGEKGKVVKIDLPASGNRGSERVTS